MSPDGRLVAYVVESLNGEKDAYQTDVWLVPTAGGEARALAASSPVGDDTPRGRPTAAGSRSSPSGHGRAPRETTRASEAPGVADPAGRRRGGAAHREPRAPCPSLEWSADGKTIAFLAREPKSDDRKRREKEKDDAWTPSEVYPWSRLW